MGRVVGIDLGTSNSCVAVMEGGNPQVIPNQEGFRTTPSIVAFTNSGQWLVGSAAKRQAITNPKNTIHGALRLLGRRFDSPEVQRIARFSPFRIIQADNRRAHIMIESRTHFPEEICARILLKLKAAAEKHLGEAVEEAILAVPSYFNAAQRQAVKDAGTIAGLEVQRILNASTAAGLAYGMTLKHSGRVAVYDLGGGTFDISILELQDGIYQVLSTGGDTLLGGEDFDHLISNWLIEGFHRETHIDLTGDPMSLERLKQAAEKAKCVLSSESRAEIDLPSLSVHQSGRKHLKAVLTRTRFEEMIEPLLERTTALCHQALKDAGLEPNDVDEVILVGGQTRTPKVPEAVAECFGKEPSRSVNPDEVVAIGAAIQTGILEGEVTDLVLLDVIPHSLGIETQGGTFTPIIARNSSIPTTRSCLFTLEGDQTDVEVHVLQGETDRADQNVSLGRLTLRGTERPLGKKARMEVAFEIDVNGIVEVSARDQASGKERRITVRAASGLTETEIKRLQKETEAAELAEKAGKERARIAGQLQGLIASTQKTFDLLSSKLTEDERAHAQETLADAQKAKEGSLEELKAALARLESTAEALGQAMLRG